MPLEDEGMEAEVLPPGRINVPPGLMRAVSLLQGAPETVKELEALFKAFPATLAADGPLGAIGLLSQANGLLKKVGLFSAVSSDTADPTSEGRRRYVRCPNCSYLFVEGPIGD